MIEKWSAVAQQFQVAAPRGVELGLNADELAFYDALADNEASVRELSVDTLKRIADELADNLRKNASDD